MPKKSPKTITISADIAIIAAIAMNEYARDQKEKGYLFTAASIHTDAATLLRKIGNDTAPFWDMIAANTLKEAKAKKETPPVIPTPAEIEAFRVKLEAKLKTDATARGVVGPLEISIVLGNRYAKIIRIDWNPSVYGFIDRKNGDLLKAASWSKPAKHARGNILAPDPLAGCGPYGLAYLRR